MIESINALAVHSKFLAKCLAIAQYAKRGAAYRDAQQVLEIFVPAGQRTDRRHVRKLTLDMLFNRLYYQISLKEHFLYQFESKTDEERRAYIGDVERLKVGAEIGDIKTRRFLSDKYECYLLFKDFFGRDMIKVSSQEDKAAFEEFLSKHKEFMVKPALGSGGEGIYRMAAESMDINECFQKVLTSAPCVVDQCIDQVYELARFHPQSVNTVRIATFNNTSGIKVLFSVFRTATGNSVVDNAAAGGVFALVNTESGKIESDGYTENGDIYQAHPDTGCVFKGFQVPHWSDLLHVTLKAAQAFPHNYVSWDFALTDSGWIIVEANTRGTFMLPQIISGGIRELFMKELREYKDHKGMTK